LSSFVKSRDSCQHELSLINTQLKDHIDLVQKAKSKLQVLQHDLDVVDVHVIELKATQTTTKGQVQLLGFYNLFNGSLISNNASLKNSKRCLKPLKPLL
jgi:hypothetical protein